MNAKNDVIKFHPKTLKRIYAISCDCFNYEHSNSCLKKRATTKTVLLHGVVMLELIPTQSSGQLTLKSLYLTSRLFNDVSNWQLTKSSANLFCNVWGTLKNWFHWKYAEVEIIQISQPPKNIYEKEWKLNFSRSKSLFSSFNCIISFPFWLVVYSQKPWRNLFMLQASAIKKLLFP